MENICISAQGIQIGDTMYPAEYSKTPTGKVCALTELAGQSLRVEFAPDHAMYGEALAAWEASYQGQPEPQEAAPETLPAKKEPEEFTPEWWEEAQDDDAQETQDDSAQQAQNDDTQQAQDDATPEAQEAPAKPAPQGETLEKIWVGTSIKGKGWEIYFDGAYGRTRVIFKRKPSDAVRQAVKDAGFFWCPAMKSWNKKLTWKAYRAAQELQKTLWKLCA